MAKEFGQICLAYTVDGKTGKSELATLKPKELTDNDWVLLQQGDDYVEISIGSYLLRSSFARVEGDGEDSPLVRYVTYDKSPRTLRLDERTRPSIRGWE